MPSRRRLRSALAALALGVLLVPLGAVGAQQELVAERVRVLYEDARLEPHARRVAERAERARALVEEALGVRMPPLVVTLDARDDLFNAVALPVPRPTVALRTRFPVRDEVGLVAPDPLLTLLIHEIAHLGHLAAREGPQPLRLGIVGERVPVPPPAWLLEGLAVWAESRLAPGGGRLDDARTRGLLRTLARDGPWPSLVDAGLITHASWPGGETRYLLGGAFVDWLVRRHGVATLLEALRAYEGGAPHLGFASAWARATGEDLHAQWRRFREALRQEAGLLARASRPLTPLGPGPGRLLGPTVSPDGSRLAWVQDGSLRVAPWRPDGSVGPTRVLRRGLAVGRPAWWGPERLVYARIEPRPDARLSHVFAIDVDSGRERRLTDLGHAFFPAPLTDRCVAYVRDVEPDGSSLRRWCDGTSPDDRELASAPGGARLVGLAASPEGRLAAVLWREGRSDPALWDPAAGWRRLLEDAGRVLEPAWDGEGALLFRSDRAGATFEAYRLELAAGRLERLTHTVGGVFSPSPGVAVAQQGSGARLVRLPSRGTAVQAVTGIAAGDAAGRPRPREAGRRDRHAAHRASFEVRRYAPWRDLAPYGWLPSGEISLAPLRASFAATLVGRDALGAHGWEASVGVSLHEQGPLGPLRGALRYLYRPQDPFAVVRRPSPFSGRLEAALQPYAPHRGTRLGLVPRLEAAGRWSVARAPDVSVAARLGLVQLPDVGWRPRGAVTAQASRARSDDWGVPRGGWSVAATLLHDPAPAGPSRAAWLTARGWWPGPAGSTLEAGGRAGWRPPAPVPSRAWGDRAAAASVGASRAWPLHARVADGRWALERVRVEPRAHLLASERSVLLAGDLTLAADLVLNYLAPVSLEVRGGWAGEPWIRAGVSMAP